MTAKGTINISDLSEEVQQAMYEELAKTFGKKRRESNHISKENKIVIVANILTTMRGLNIAQQRSVLNFTLQVLENAQKRYWRDKNGEGVKSG